MTKTSSTILPILLGLILIVGCSRTHYSEELRQIDSMIVELDSARNIHRRIDTTGYGEAMKKYTTRMSSIQGSYASRGDTMERDVAMMMASYRELKKPLERFKKSYAAVSTDLEFTRTQLLDLKHDLEHNLLDSNLVHKMLREEDDAVTRIRMETDQLKMSYKVTEDKTQKLEPKVDSLLHELKKLPDSTNGKGEKSTI